MDNHCVCGRIRKDGGNWNPEFDLCRDCSRYRYDEMRVNNYLASFCDGDLVWLYGALCILKLKGDVWWELVNVGTNETESWCPYSTRTYRDLMTVLRHSDDT